MGVASAVSAGDVVRAVDEVGRNMKSIYRETSEGGWPAVFVGVTRRGSALVASPAPALEVVIVWCCWPESPVV